MGSRRLLALVYLPHIAPYSFNDCLTIAISGHKVMPWVRTGRKTSERDDLCPRFKFCHVFSSFLSGHIERIHSIGWQVVISFGRENRFRVWIYIYTLPASVLSHALIWPHIRQQTKTECTDFQVCRRCVAWLFYLCSVRRIVATFMLPRYFAVEHLTLANLMKLPSPAFRTCGVCLPRIIVRG